MYKHALMLTVATIALAAGSAAYADTTITTTNSSAQKTSTDGNILMGDPTSTPTKDGIIAVTIANPAVEIDSANYVQLNTPGSTIKNTGTTGAIGVQMDATVAGTNGPANPGNTVNALYSLGKIDLTGAGTGKYGIWIRDMDTTGATTPAFNGNIYLGAASTLNVTGDSSFGIKSDTNTTLNGNVTILGSILVAPSSTTAVSGGGVTGMQLSGTTNGNVLIDTGGSVQAIGQGATGLAIGGAINGNLTFNGALASIGTQAPSATGTNPEASSALVVANSISGGIYLNGPVSTADATTRASITTYGNANAVVITPGAAGATSTAITIGGSSAEANAASTLSGAAPVTAGATSAPINGFYGFFNRGTIQVKPHDADLTGATAINIAGAPSYGVTIQGGIYNSGNITGTATTDAKATLPITASGIVIGQYVNVGTLVNNHSESSAGIISANVSGSNAGAAYGITIGQYSTLNTLINTGTISATASSSDLTIKNQTNTSGTVNPGLAAYAVVDTSGTLTNIVNTGTISATTSILNDNSQTSVALGLSAASSNINIANTGSIIGDVLLGSGNDTVTLSGSSTQAANITGNINFGGGTDTLVIGDYSTVTGSLSERGGGQVAITIGSGAGTGTLTLLNNQTNPQTLNVSSLMVNNGGTLGITVAQPFNSTSTGYVGPVISSTGQITMQQLANFKLKFGSFISAPGQGQSASFVLLDAPVGNLNLANYTTLANTINNTQIPFLFTGQVCTYNVAGLTPCAGTIPATANNRAQLVLNLQPKTAAQIGLTGNAAKIFSYANAALATDPTLGGTFIADVGNSTAASPSMQLAQNMQQAQNAYEGFVPDVSGSSRAVVISITDQATGPVAARQRALRMYANQDGDTTLWGQQFFQRLNSGNDADGYRGSGFGFTLGADTGAPDTGRYGAAFTFFSGDQTNKSFNFDKTNNEWYMLTGYTDWRGKGLFLDSQLSVGYGNLTTSRYLDLYNASGSLDLQRLAQGKTAGLTLAGGVTSGVIFTYGGTVLTPQISLDGMMMRQNGYRENGGGSGVTGQDGLDLIVQPYYANSARGYFGTSVRHDINFGDFYLQPELRVGYRYDFLAQAVKLKAAFVATPDSQFSLTGPDPEKGNVVAGASLAVSQGTWSFGVNYDYLSGIGGAVDQIGTITLLGRL